jgi:membrane-associated protein
MSMRRFVTYSAIGGVVWASGVTLLGYYLGSVSFLADNTDLVLIGIVALSVIPMGLEVRRQRSGKKSAATRKRGSDD